MDIIKLISNQKINQLLDSDKAQLSQSSKFSKIMNPKLQNRYLNFNTIDRQNIVEQYRIRRQNNSDILTRINLDQALKRQVFGFNESKYCVNKAKKHQIVTVNHFNRGKLIMKEDDYQNNLKKKTSHKGELKQNNRSKDYAQLDIQPQNIDESLETNTRLIDEFANKGNPEENEDLSTIQKIVDNLDQQQNHQNPQIIRLGSRKQQSGEKCDEQALCDSKSSLMHIN